MDPVSSETSITNSTSSPIEKKEDWKITTESTYIALNSTEIKTSIPS